MRAVELAPRSAASHRAVGTVATALGDFAQAESAYRNARLLDSGSGARPADPGAVSGGRHASDRATALAARMASHIAGDRPPTDAASRANGSRHAAPEDARTGGRHGLPDPSTGGRRRAPEPATAVWSASALGGVTDRAGAGSAVQVQRTTAVGLPSWLGRVGAAPGPDGWGHAAAGTTPVADPGAWRRGLITVVRIEWLVGVVCFLGLAFARTAPFTAGLLAGTLVVAGGYGRLRWRGSTARRPPEPDRIPTYVAVASVATAVVIIPAAMVGALPLARLAAVAAVSCATVAAVLLARPVGKDR
jgi:hypothetical protein